MPKKTLEERMAAAHARLRKAIAESGPIMADAGLGSAVTAMLQTREMVTREELIAHFTERLDPEGRVTMDGVAAAEIIRRLRRD